jgi:hypothetical protein
MIDRIQTLDAPLAGRCEKKECSKAALCLIYEIVMRRYSPHALLRPYEFDLMSQFTGSNKRS